MSKIDKLSILGVRSFDNTRSETIQFYSPLTLVVGSNGSGKTTIIECLKYATTGILPPNSKGGAFIHDPKLAGEREVLAQVKLSFKAATGARMVATRSLQLTVKKLTRQQKTLEGQLLMVKEGERTAISSRVAELDQIIPQYLGVPTAVIDNVIFCHQDESLWPMSEPSVLKKKFDEIFEAQKYTKAIENIKQLRKKQNEDLGKLKIMEGQAKSTKAMAEKTEKRMLKLQEDIEHLREECTQLDQQMNRAGELAHQAKEQYDSYNAITDSLEIKKNDAASRRDFMQRLEQSMTEVPESEEWLSSTLDQFHSRIEQYEKRKEAQLEAFQNLQSHLRAKQAQRGEKQAEKGKISAAKDQYEKEIHNRRNLVKEIARGHSLRGYEDVSDDHHLEEFMQRFRKIARDQSSALAHARDEANSKRREAQALVNQLEQRQKALQESKSDSRRLITQNDAESQQIRNSINRISADEGSKAVIESRMEDVSHRLRKVEADAKKSSRSQALAEAQGQVHQYETDARQLREELVQGTKRAEEMAELTHLKKISKDSTRSLETMISVHGDRLREVLGDDWQPTTIETAYQTTLENRERELAAAERDRNIASRELEQCEFKARSVSDEIKKKEKLVQESARKVREAIDDEPTEFEEILLERQGAVDAMKEDAGQMIGLSNFMQQILTVANEKGICRTCTRPFRTDAELARFKTRMEGLVKKAQSDTQEGELKEREKELQEARDATIHYETWKQLSENDLPALKQEQSRLSTDRQTLLSRLEECDRLVEQRQDAKKNVESLLKTVQSITKYDADIKASDRRVHQLTSQPSQAHNSRTFDEIQEQMVQVEKKEKEAREVVSRLTREEESLRAETARLELELSGLRADLNTSNFQLEKKASLLVDLEKLKASSNKHREAVAKADNEIDTLGSEIAKAKAKYDDIEENAKSREKELQIKVDKVSADLQELNYSSRKIKDYVEAGGPDQLARVQRELKAIEDETTQAEVEQGNLTREINQLKEQISSSSATRRNYSDNLQHRQMSRALRELEIEIEDLASRVSEVDKARAQEEQKRREREYQFLSGQREGKMGEMKSKDNQLAELLADYETDFKDSARQYKEAHIKTETTKAAVEDLGRYGAALDKAIMTYHAMKMEEINRIIEELWQRTYQGTDVDTIMIRSDNENAKGNRNYNYRVSMVKQDAEMDMRGRCSAGQKVLASIIIRLALAECFGVNCGLIALDEPTTNLDRDNIRSLAESLHDIIKHRQQQANFQLIVITHDEEFLRHMQCGDFSDYYYRVSRNERQKSIIERQSIAEVL
jgi:DNA repair protein RAD50